MTRILSPFAPGLILSVEQGGTGQGVGAVGAIGTLLGSDGASLVPITLIGSGIAVNVAVPGQITLSAAGGLTNFTDGVNSAAPNNVVPVVSLTATNAAADVDAAFVPKGNGALLSCVPDGAGTAGATGNKRGAKAVDLQLDRGVTAAASKVASGALSFIGGGSGNRASGLYSAVPGGLNVLAGGIASFGAGSTNTPSGDYSFIPGGKNATTRAIYGTSAHASGRFSADGDAQATQFILRGQSVNVAPVVLTTDGAPPMTTLNGIVVTLKGTYIIRGDIIAASNAGDYKAFSYLGILLCPSGDPLDATLVNSAVTTIGNTAGAAAWTLAAAADTTVGGGGAKFTGVGLLATTVNFVARLTVTECTFP